VKHSVIIVAALALSGCAAPPDRIVASDVSPTLYSHLDCRALNIEAQRIHSRLTNLTGAQRRAANNDTAMTAVTLVLFWPAMFLVGRNDHAPEIARLRGEAEAVSIAARQRGC
jgi:uncharacterized protein YcfL